MGNIQIICTAVPMGNGDACIRPIIILVTNHGAKSKVRHVLNLNCFKFKIGKKEYTPTCIQPISCLYVIYVVRRAYNCR